MRSSRVVSGWRSTCMVLLDALQGGGADKEDSLGTYKVVMNEPTGSLSAAVS